MSLTLISDLRLSQNQDQLSKVRSPVAYDNGPTNLSVHYVQSSSVGPSQGCVNLTRIQRQDHATLDEPR